MLSENVNFILCCKIASLLFGSICYFLIIRLMFFNIFLMFFSFCVFCAFVFFFCVLFLLEYIAVSFLLLYKFTDHCRRVETQLQ